ncbi:MAG: hypothetical protein AAF702_45490 [Chloroflexota bacterium]
MTKEFRLKTPLGLLLLISLLVAAACAPTAAVPLDGELQELAIVTTANTLSSPRASTQQGTEAFDTVMSVLTSPRCSNCHPTGDRPRQRDEQIFHILNVTRGEDNHGGPVQTCETCHHEENNPYSLVPGAPHWGLAPKSMGWFGLTHAEIAQSLLDPEKNGGRSHEDLLHHMSNDALVLWAWDPGADRTTPPVSHEEFVQALEEWLDAGAPIPGE